MTTHRIPVGTLCVVVNCATMPQANGMRVTVLAYLRSDRHGRPCYVVTGGLTASEVCLRPIYDGNQPSLWEDCEWVPKGVKKVRKDSEYTVTYQESEDMWSRVVTKILQQEDKRAR